MLSLASSVVLALLATATAQDENRLPVEQYPPQEDLETLRGSFSPLHPVPQRPLPRTPLRVSADNLLHGLFGFLPLEAAETIEEGRFHLTMQEEISSGDLEILEPDYFFRYEATRVETSLVGRLGIVGDWELGAAVDVSNLLEDEGDIILIRRGQTLVREATRSTAVGDVRLWTKKRLLGTGERGALSALLAAKLPVSRSKEDLLTSGAVDFAASLLWSQEFGAIAFHANVGAILPGDVEVFEEDVETRNAFTFGVGVSCEFAPWGHLAAQVQGHQSVFEDSSDSIAIFDEMGMTAHLGGRFRIGSYVLEASLGTGLTDQSADTILTISITLPL